MHLPVTLIASSLLLAGCLAIDETPDDSRDVPVQAFVKGMTPDDVRPSVVEVPATEYEPQPSTDDGSGDDQDATKAAGPDKPADRPAEALRPGQDWPVDALIGQVNGKPLYADEFLASREDRIRQLVAQPDRVAARRQLIQLLDEAFDQFVNNQLVISEAERAIPVEAKEGLLEWMRKLQEREIANRGGTRSEAQRSIEEEFPGTTIEEFTQRQKNEILAGELLMRRIKPRAIVSWRDVERLYMKDWEKYNPPLTLRVGRIALPKSDEVRVARVKAMLADGRSFAEVAAELQLPNQGLWKEFKLGPKGIDGIPDLVDDLKARLKVLKEGVVDGPVEQRSQVTWMTLLPSTQAKPTSIFDPKLQLGLRRQLEGEQFSREQARYFYGLRSRWIAEDLSKMKLRLIDFALDRYWRQGGP